MQWVEMENPEGKKIPKWKRSAGFSNESTVFVPAAIAGSENEVYLCAAYDGTQTVTYLNHIYVPAEWLGSEFSDTAAICEIMSKNIRDICSQHNLADC